MFTLICVWINGCVNNSKAGDLRCYCAHYGVTVMESYLITLKHNNRRTACIIIGVYYRIFIVTFNYQRNSMYAIKEVNGVSKIFSLFLSIPKLQQRSRWSLGMDFIPRFIMDVILYPVIKDGRLKSPASRLFTQPSIQTQINENIKAPRHWPLVRGIHRWRGKSFHLMMSSWEPYIATTPRMYCCFLSNYRLSPVKCIFQHREW